MTNWRDYTDPDAGDDDDGEPESEKGDKRQRSLWDKHAPERARTEKKIRELTERPRRVPSAEELEKLRQEFPNLKKRKGPKI